MDQEIQLINEQGEVISMYVVEQTVLAGTTYLLTSDAPEGDANAFILKDVSAPEDEDACYVEVEDEAELAAVAGIFAEMLEETDLI